MNDLRLPFDLVRHIGANLDQASYSNLRLVSADAKRALPKAHRAPSCTHMSPVDVLIRNVRACHPGGWESIRAHVIQRFAVSGSRYGVDNASPIVVCALRDNKMDLRQVRDLFTRAHWVAMTSALFTSLLSSIYDDRATVPILRGMTEPDLTAALASIWNW